MNTPCIITVAITGSLPRKSDNPAVPISVNEQIESTHEAFEAGATLVHLHVRNDDGTPTSDPERFAAVLAGIRAHCLGIIMQVSTGGRSGAGHERGAMLSLKPDMASLATGSVNFPTRVYDNSPQLVDWLAQEMLTYGVKPEVEAFEFYVRTLERLAPDSTWTGAGIGKDQITLARWSLELGGHCRTELEDNVRLDRQRLAPSKAALVRQVVELCAEYGRRAATPAEARALLGLTSLTEESTWK